MYHILHFYTIVFQFFIQKINYKIVKSKIMVLTVAYMLQPTVKTIVSQRVREI
jgi:hypothetical protein